MQAFVGGVQATIAYQGRSQFPGVDQIVLTIPGSVPTGCYVSLAIVSGNIVSNSVTIPVAASRKNLFGLEYRPHARRDSGPEWQDNHQRGNSYSSLNPPALRAQARAPLVQSAVSFKA